MVMLDDLKDLPEDPEDLKGLVGLLADELKSRDILIEKLKHQLAGLNRHRFGSRSESLDQLHLTFSEDEAIACAAAEQTAPAATDQKPDPTRPERRHNRKPLPDHLERNETVLSPGENCGACGGALKTLGEDVTEELEYVPGRFVVNRLVRPRLT